MWTRRKRHWLLPGLSIDALATATVAWAPEDSAGKATMEHNPEAMACNLTIIVNNTGSKNAYLYIYNSQMRVNSWTVPALLRNWNDMKIQNARVAPGAEYRGTFSGAKGGCNVRRSWKVRYKVTGGTEKWVYLPDTKNR